MRNLTILVLSFLLISCTQMIWSNITSYNEEIGGFYVDTNNNDLIAVGRTYNYIFKIEDDLIEILDISNKIQFKPEFSEFSIDSNKKVNGYLKLSVITNDLNTNEYDRLLKLHFKLNKDKLKFNVKLKGAIYKSDSSLLKIINFYSPYRIKVNKPTNLAEVSLATLATPIAVVIDITAYTVTAVSGAVYKVFATPKETKNAP